MYKFLITLIINFIIANHVPNTETRETLYFKPISEQEAVDLLDEIKPNQVLPLAQLLNETDNKLQSPKSLERVITNDKRIINGTQFSLENNIRQMWFCPNVNSNQDCLEPKYFQGLDPLQCAKEPTLIVQGESEKISCGDGDAHLPHSVIYEFCPTDEDDYKNEQLLLYTFCYDTQKEKTVFTSHLIQFPELLDSKVLRHEQNIKYNMEPTLGFTPSNTPELKDALAQEESNLPNTEQDAAKKHVYKLQKLTPTEDMAFASMRKSTYQFLNAELQHEALMPLWNEINDDIRKKAKIMRIIKGVEFSIYTGVFDSASESRKDGQKSNVWVKLVYSLQGCQSDESPLCGMAIMMNNFIDKTTEDPATLTPNSTENSILDYCKDSCEKTLEKKFKQVGGRVRCCSISAKIQEIFRWVGALRDSPSLYLSGFKISLLRIPGVNEIGDDPSEITQPDESSV